jgi:hypothetical protein
MDFSECMTTAEEPKACKDFRDDYLECLHHRKEVRPAAEGTPGGRWLLLLLLQVLRHPSSVVMGIADDFGLVAAAFEN